MQGCGTAQADGLCVVDQYLFRRRGNGQLLGTLLLVALLVFLTGNLVRIIRFLRTPVPLRWELYPIPRGPKERQRYGGSYFEKSEWWAQGESPDGRSELIFIAKEVLALKSVRQNFLALWVCSFLLHWGLYLYPAAVAFAWVCAAWRVPQLFPIATIFFWISCVAGLLGSVSLLFLRITHPRLRSFTTRVSVFSLLLLGSIFASGLAALETVVVSASTVIQTFQKPSTPSILSAHLTLVALFLAYFPFTHMTHAYMKFFSWHGMRWNDSPAAWNPDASAATKINLRRPVGWAAPHIRDERPTTTWSDVVNSSAQSDTKRA